MRKTIVLTEKSNEGIYKKSHQRRVYKRDKVA